MSDSLVLAQGNNTAQQDVSAVHPHLLFEHVHQDVIRKNTCYTKVHDMQMLCCHDCHNFGLRFLFGWLAGFHHQSRRHIFIFSSCPFIFFLFIICSFFFFMLERALVCAWA